MTTVSERRKHSRCAEPLKSPARADDRALTQSAKQEQPPPQRDNPIGTAANGANADDFDPVQAAFEKVKCAYPQDRVGDEAAAYRAFRAVHVGRRMSAVLDDIDTLKRDYSADLPLLAELLWMVQADD